MSVNFEMSVWCLHFLKKEQKQVDLRYHSSKVESVCSFFGRNVGLNKSVWSLEATLYLDEDRRKSLEQLCVNLLSWLDLNSKKIFLTFLFWNMVNSRCFVQNYRLSRKTGHHHATATFEYVPHFHPVSE